MLSIIRNQSMSLSDDLVGFHACHGENSGKHNLSIYYNGKETTTIDACQTEQRPRLMMDGDLPSEKVMV